MCYFLVSEQESNQRSRPGRGITNKSQKLWSDCHRQSTCFDSLRGAPPLPGPHSRRVSHRPLKMSRFSAGSAVQTSRFVKCKRSKIGTFLNAGWRCGGGYLRGGAPRSESEQVDCRWQSLHNFCDLPVAPLRSASFGPFLAETRKGHKRCQFAKLKFINRTVLLDGKDLYCTIFGHRLSSARCQF